MSGEPTDPQVASLLASVERLQVREARLAALYATANDLTAIRDVEEILAAIVGRARQLLGTDIAYVGLSDPEAGTVDIRVIDGAVSAAFANLRMEFGTGLLGLVASTGVPYATPDYHEDERFAHRGYIDDAVSTEHIRAILGVPMKVKGTTIGALLAANRSPRPFPTEEVELLTSFAAHAAIALENARLFSAAEEATERIAAQAAAVERAARTHDRLTAALVGEGDVDAVAAVLAEDLGADVEVRDADGRVRARAGDETGGALPQPSADQVRESVAAGRSVLLDDGGTACLAAAAAGGDPLGTVVAARSTPLEAADLRTLDRAALGVAVLLSFERTVALADGRAREDLLRELLEGPADVGRTRALLQREGVDADAPHVVLAALVDGSRDPARRRLEAWVRGERGLAGTRDDLVLALVPGDDPVVAGERVAHVVGPATVGAEAVPHLRDGAGTACEGALTTVRALVALGRTGEVASPATLGSARFLLAAGTQDDAARFVESTVGPVLAWDDARGTGLAATVEHWCAASASASGAARTLHVHPNTVVQRLERVDALLGPSWREPDRLLDVRLALRMWRLRTHA